MTVAICFKCGAFKTGAFNWCEACGAQPVNLDEIALSMALTDHFYDKPTLDQIRAELVFRKRLPIDPMFVLRIRDELGTPTGQRMIEMSRRIRDDVVLPPDQAQANRGEATNTIPPVIKPPVISSQPRNNTDMIAKRLVSIEMSRPGTVRMHANPFMLSQVVEGLRQLGFKKPFFTSAQQFIFDSVLTHEAAMVRCLPSSMLAGPTNREGWIQCWAGSGPFIGEQGLIQIGDFTSGGKDRVVLIINIEPFFAELADLLGEAKHRE